jgi:[protein-PII] uridylyltransferase
MAEPDERATDVTRTVDATVEPGPTPGTWSVGFRSEAVSGTLAAFAGTLTAARLDIISAVIRRSSDGSVTDTFDVEPLDGSVLGESDGRRLAAAATEVLNGRRDLAGELLELRRAYPPRLGIVPRVDTQTDSELTTGIKVMAADRPGLLYDLTCVLSRHGFRTRALSVLTYAGKAHDTFRVVDADGAPPKDPLALSRVRLELLQVCEP